MPLKTLKDLSFDAADGLITLAGGIDALSQKISGYYENFYSADERNAQTLGNVSAALASVGLSMPKTRDAFRALVEAQDLNTEAGRKAYATLMNVADAFASITPSAEDLAKAAQQQAEAVKAQAEAERQARRAATDAASSSLERAAAAEKSRLQAVKQVAQESVNTLSSIFSNLKSNVAELYASVESTQAQSARAGLQFIDQALANARSTGYLPDAGSLSDAITAARSGLDSSQFGSAFEQQRAQLTLAGKLSELQDLSGVQKTLAEQQLAAAEDQLASLDKILSNAKDQVDALRGIDTSVKTVAEGLQNLADALLEERKSAGTAAGGKDIVGVGPGGVGFGGGATAANPITPGQKTADGQYLREVNLGNGAFYVPVTDPADNARIDAVKGITQFEGTGDVAGYAQAVQAMGGSLSDIASALGYRYEDVLLAAERAGIPRFDVGTNYVPQDMLALIHQGEAIVPKAFNPAAHGLPSTSDATAELLARLIAEVQALRERVGDVAVHTKSTAEAVHGNQHQPLLVEIAP